VSGIEQQGDQQKADFCIYLVEYIGIDRCQTLAGKMHVGMANGS
jgi:hypothetical protein